MINQFLSEHSYSISIAVLIPVTCADVMFFMTQQGAPTYNSRTIIATILSTLTLVWFVYLTPQVNFRAVFLYATAVTAFSNAVIWPKAIGLYSDTILMRRYRNQAREITSLTFLGQPPVVYAKSLNDLGGFNDNED